MNLLKKLPLFILPLLLLTACKKVTKFETTGTLIINFKNGVPACYNIYTEASYNAPVRYPLYQSGGSRPADINVEINGGSITFEGLNYGNYVVTGCGVGVLVVQVAAGTSREYTY
jgi:hypothetical protein